MVLEKTITVYIDETTGKEYKTFKTAQEKELQNRKFNVIETFAKEVGFDGNKQLLEYFIEQESKLPSSNIKLTLQVLKIKNSLYKLLPSDSEQARNVLKSIWGQTQAALQELQTYKLTVFLDNKEVLSKTITNYSMEKDIFYEYATVIDLEKHKEKEFVVKENTIKVYFETSKIESSISKWEAFKKADGLNWRTYQDYLYDYRVDLEVELTPEEEFYALESWGVDNWNGYDYAIELATEDGYDYFDLEPEDKLSYLEAAGVDNWNGYFDALKEARTPELTDDDYKKVLDMLVEDGELKNWGNYKKFIDLYRKNKP